MLYTVHVHLDKKRLVARMSEMRIWLDAHRYEPDLFQYQMAGRGAVVCVDFKFQREAFAFAEAFDRSVLR